MDLIQGYSSSNESIKSSKESPSKSQIIKIDPSPQVDIQEKYQELKRKREESLNKLYPKTQKPNHLTGQADQFYMDDFNFEEQYYNFQSFGIQGNPNPEKLQQNQSTQSSFGLTSKRDKEFKKNLRKDRIENWNPGSDQFQGPWAGYQKEKSLINRELTQEQKDQLQKMEEKRKQKEVQAEEQKFEVRTEFHGQIEYDYQGRSFIYPSSDLNPKPHACYIPKKCAHCWSGHTKGVQVIKFYPKYGHFLLSGSLDTKIKLWDVNKNRKCMRTYMGHTQAIRDLCFTNDGLHFLSASYDQTLHYWDTETGKVVRTFHIKKYPYCVRFNPEPDKQHSFLLGSSNKKIGQYDVRSGHRTQQYDEHLGSVNTVTFIDNNRKFVSTSDDKKIFLWEFGIPVVLKHISEPEMHSITQTVMHPSNKYFAGQSQDNKIVIYDAKGGNFRLNRKKKFIGHLNSGYAISLDISPDGQFLGSGDSDGRAWFWDWKTSKVFRTIDAHEGVCIGLAWHPIEPSKVATCGWDGTIMYWD